MAQIYQTNQAFSNSTISIKHKNDSISLLNITIKTNEILFSRIEPSDPFTANLKLKIIAVDDNSIIVDSSTTVHNVIRDSSLQETISLTQKLKIQNSFSGIIIIFFHAPPLVDDKMFVRSLKKINNASLEWFEYQLRSNELIISKANYSPFSILIYKDSADWPLPPFSIENKKEFSPQISREITVNEKDTIIHFFSYEKFIQLKRDSNASDYQWIPSDHFPKVKSAEEMLMPLRYLTSKKEFEKMENDSNILRSVELFWLKIGGTQERARRLIADYYKGVETSNIFFSDYRPGWKTDRGMIFTIFGEPDILYKSRDRETWIYGESNSLYSLTFEFFLKNNIFVLQRNPGFKENWYQAVELWRQ